MLLSGSAEFRIDGDRTEAVTGQIVRVGPAARRKLIPGPEGVRVLAIGCSGDRPYERPKDFQLQVSA